jgi:hypothetical protein
MDSGFGGLIARQIGITTSVMAELWTLMDGLAFASPLEFSHLVVELDPRLLKSGFYAGSVKGLHRSDRRIELWIVRSYLFVGKKCKNTLIMALYVVH